MYRNALIAFVLLLNGCGLFTPRVEERVEYRVFDDAWLVPCAILPPPDPKLYQSSTDRVRAILWSKVYVDQVKELHACRERAKAAKAYNDHLRELNSKKP